MHKKEIVLVCGYGCHLNHRYVRYLGKVASYARKNSPQLILVLGGFSQKKSFPKISESNVIKSFLGSIMRGSILEKAIDVLVVGEDDFINEKEMSLTTNENLENARIILESWRGKISPETHRLTIFCDAIRALKIKIVAEKVFRHYDIQIETHDLSGVDNAKKQLLFTFFDIFTFYIPLFSLLERKTKEIRAKKS